MNFAPNASPAATETPRPRRRRRSGLPSVIHRTRSRTSAQPLHEALALGLGCTATGYRMSTPAEWR